MKDKKIRKNILIISIMYLLLITIILFSSCSRSIQCPDIYTQKHSKIKLGELKNVPYKYVSKKYTHERIIDTTIIEDVSMNKEVFEEDELPIMVERKVVKSVYFHLDKFDYTLVDLSVIVDVIDYLKKDYKLVLEGHTDHYGHEGYNKQLAYNRAESIKKLIINLYPQISEDEIVIISYGEDRQMYKDHRKNRRVDIVLMKEYLIVKNGE